jgi:hypothetical protein
VLFHAPRHAPPSRLNILAVFGRVFRARTAPLRENITGRPQYQNRNHGDKDRPALTLVARYIGFSHHALLFVIDEILCLRACLLFTPLSGLQVGLKHETP